MPVHRRTRKRGIPIRRSKHTRRHQRTRGGNVVTVPGCGVLSRNTYNNHVRRGNLAEVCNSRS